MQYKLLFSKFERNIICCLLCFILIIKSNAKKHSFEPSKQSYGPDTFQASTQASTRGIARLQRRNVHYKHLRSNPATTKKIKIIHAPRKTLCRRLHTSEDGLRPRRRHTSQLQPRPCLAACSHWRWRWGKRDGVRTGDGGSGGSMRRALISTKLICYRFGRRAWVMQTRP